MTYYQELIGVTIDEHSMRYLLTLVVDRLWKCLVCNDTKKLVQLCYWNISDLVTSVPLKVRPLNANIVQAYAAAAADSSANTNVKYSFYNENKLLSHTRSYEITSYSVILMSKIPKSFIKQKSCFGWLQQ